MALGLGILMSGLVFSANDRKNGPRIKPGETDCSNWRVRRVGSELECTESSEDVGGFPPGP